MSHRQMRVVVESDWCKGCGICVAFCPTNTFDMIPGDKAVAAREEDCTGCGLCERLCPDLAIRVLPVGPSEQSA